MGGWGRQSGRAACITNCINMHENKDGGMAASSMGLPALQQIATQAKATCGEHAVQTKQIV